MQQMIKVSSETKQCNITFIIGNGFDLSLGMKTKYTDVYADYIKSPSSSDIIANFKKELKSKEANNYEKWSDFEMGMAEYAKTLPSEEVFVKCVRDFKGYMVQHLQEENNRAIEWIRANVNNQAMMSELSRSLEQFYDGLIPNDVNKMKAMMRKSNIVRDYITFNYTTSLDEFLVASVRHNKFLESTPIHIHGKLGSDIVLGVDDSEQLSGISYSLTKKGERAFVKTIFNEQFDMARVESAKKVIHDSSIICIYGFAMGESDNTWVWTLSDWLEKDDSHHLVVYQYDTPKCNTYNYDEIMEIEEDRKEKVFKRMGIENRSILNQIHIPVGRDIFNFGSVEDIPSETEIEDDSIFVAINT